MVIKGLELQLETWNKLERMIDLLSNIFQRHEDMNNPFSGQSHPLYVEGEDFQPFIYDLSLVDFIASLDREYAGEDSYFNHSTAKINLISLWNAVKRRDKSGLRESFDEFCEMAEGAKWRLESFLEEMDKVLDILEIEEGALLYLPDKPLITIPSPLILVSDDLLRKLSSNPALLFTLSPRKFEEVIADIFHKNGFNVELTKMTRDGGQDIIAINNNLNIKTKYIIECKRWAEKRKIGLGIVQRLLGVKISTAANKGILATTSTFSRDALKFAENHIWDLDLKDYEDIVGWIRSFYPIS